eukprot:scaffold3713_cov112-Isochrysis_galbana.AAC.2
MNLGRRPAVRRRIADFGTGATTGRRGERGSTEISASRRHARCASRTGGLASCVRRRVAWQAPTPEPHQR